MKRPTTTEGRLDLRIKKLEEKNRAIELKLIELYQKKINLIKK